MFSFHVVDRIVRPRCEAGCDWSSERIVLARKGDRELWWHKSGKSYRDRLSGYQPFEASLILWKKGYILGDTVHEGGRLSKKLLLSHAETINKFFGCKIADKLDIKKTLIVEES